LAELTNQLQAFGLTLILGLISGVIFHYYQLFIRQARVGRYSLYLMDLFLWLLIIIMVFGAMIWINQGEIRFYILIALLSGILLYFHTLSARFHPRLSNLAHLNVRILAGAAQWFKQVGSRIKALCSGFMHRRQSPPPDPE